MQYAVVNIYAKINQNLIINGEGFSTKIIDVIISITPNLKDDFHCKNNRWCNLKGDFLKCKLSNYCRILNV